MANITIDQAEEMIRKRITNNNKKEITGQAMQDVLLAVTSGVKKLAEKNHADITSSVNELRTELNDDLAKIKDITEWEIGKLF
jgi:hypothetical protein